MCGEPSLDVHRDRCDHECSSHDQCLGPLTPDSRGHPGAVPGAEGIGGCSLDKCPVLTCVDENGIHVDFGAEGTQDEPAGRPEHQHCEQDSCKETGPGDR